MKQWKRDTLATCLCRQPAVTSKEQCTLVQWALHTQIFGSKSIEIQTPPQNAKKNSDQRAFENELLKHLPVLLVDCPGTPDGGQTIIMCAIKLLLHAEDKVLHDLCCRGF